MEKVLILCTGNSCRSQMAAVFLKQAAPNTIVCSAGTEPAKEVNSGAVTYMKELQIDISNESPKSVNQYLDESWDYVITVCGGANESCPMFSGMVKHRVHIGFEDPSHVKGDEKLIEDTFRRVRDDIKERFYLFAKENNLT